MAHPMTRAESAIESFRHIACAVTVFIVVYLIAGLIGDGVVALTRYWSG